MDQTEANGLRAQGTRSSAHTLSPECSALAAFFSPEERRRLTLDGLLNDLGGVHLPWFAASTPRARAASLPTLPEPLVWAGRTAAWVWTGSRRRPFYEAMTAPGRRWDIRRDALGSGVICRIRHMRLQHSHVDALDRARVTGPTRTARDLAMTLEHPDDCVLLADLAAQHRHAVERALPLLPAGDQTQHSAHARRALQQALALSR
ncbi:hypothetical protein F8O07_08285 [Pseudoclavibacter sp. CFCC 13796]|uniref:hypothetical protein n=1 Tax=Pseudoclavibacter sp. CFCC 13796 TaxID=2615179 RepID=UPI001301834B|nr:hypothetical protein [Pseudoclavibacter sp. CFCC 13796]KAB1661870.1 hypothetical protein F8O07_08285 [Pseudoclavibacter sp. CFCC 13796]